MTKLPLFAVLALALAPPSALIRPASADTEVPNPEEAGADAVELTPEKQARALAFMKEAKPERRKAAYAAFRKLGDARKETYAELLEKARAFHDDKLGTMAFDLSFADNSVTQFRKVHQAWVEQRDTALKMVQTDWKAADAKRYHDQHEEMDREFEKTESAYARMISAAAKAGKKELAGLEGTAAALIEITDELAWCSGREPKETTLLSLLKRSDNAEGFMTTMASLESAKALAVDLAASGKHNAASSWASAPVKAFADIINPRRVALGLSALRLDEKLSEACAGHSAEMAELGYFAHESPVEANKSFTDRARNAAFDGFASGECIFMGGSSAAGAHKAWWYSDGHRLIMYATGPNTLGLGTNGNHWTLNTGSRKWE